MTPKTAMQQLIEDIRNGNDISFLNDKHGGHYLDIEKKQQELISAQRYIDGFNKAKEKHKVEHGNTWDSAINAHDARGHVNSRSYSDFDEYYENTFKK
jgi:hypothetical protein